jgi:hypothetical protein
MLSFKGRDREEPHPLMEDCPSNKELTRRVLANYSQMVPRNFEISQLLDEISSFVECNANHGIVFHGAQEASHRERERAFSRWRLICQKVGIDNHFLDDLPQCERELVCRSFVQTLHWNNIDPTKGTISGRTNHMAASTIRTATSLLGAMFKCHYRESPFHLQGNQELCPSIQQLLRAFENVDPPPKRQKAITPRLLRCLARYGSTSRIVERSYDHAVDLIIAAFFFAMRSCEYTITPKEGLTKRITLGNVTFRDDRKNIIKHSDLDLENKARYVTVRFEAQKNREKCDVKTQRSTGDYVLCPL